jgi:hypothetical protein
VGWRIIYSSASNSAKGSTEVEPATVIPACFFWQPTSKGMVESSERIHSRQRSLDFFDIVIGSLGILEYWSIGIMG